MVSEITIMNELILLKLRNQYNTTIFDNSNQVSYATIYKTFISKDSYSDIQRKCKKKFGNLSRTALRKANKCKQL